MIYISHQTDKQYSQLHKSNMVFATVKLQLLWKTVIEVHYGENKNAVLNRLQDTNSGAHSAHSYDHY